VVGQSNLAIRQAKDQVTDPQVLILEVQAPLHLLLGHDEHHPQDLHLEGLTGLAPEHELCSGRHHHSECGQLSEQLGMTGSSNLHALR
jgi:hypothetical protein